MYSEPSGQWSAPAPAAYRERPNLGVFVLVGGLATTLFGMFALPIQDPIKGDNGGLSAVYFGVVNQLANLGTFPLFGSVAKLWWSWLGLLVLGVLAVAVAAAAALPAARRLLGWVSLVVTLGAAALYSFALQQTGDVLQLARTFVRRGTSFDVAGSGLWVGYVGLSVLALGSLLTALIPPGPSAPAPGPAFAPGPVPGPATGPTPAQGPYPPPGWQPGPPQQQWQDQPQPPTNPEGPPSQP
jgi:hypothetical protein